MSLDFPLPLPIDIVITNKKLIDKVFIILNAYNFSWGSNHNIDYYLTFRQINAIYLENNKILLFTSGKHKSHDTRKEYTDKEFLDLNL